MTETSATAVKVLLRTADQYMVWKSRVADACWAATHKDVFALDDGDCKRGIDAFIKAQEDRAKVPKAEAPEGPIDWVGKCWLIITSSLHDDLYRKINVPRGMIKQLLVEVEHALVINYADAVQPLRLELYGATMQKDGGNDLQTYIAYLLERQNKLKFLGKPVEDEELAAIFLRGLHPVFNQLKVVFAIPGQEPKRFDVAVGVVRKFAADPTVAAEIAKLKSNGLSQNMFPVTTQPPPANNKYPQILCRQFSTTGACTYGNRCRFAHTTTPAQGGSQTNSGGQTYNSRKCTFCGFPGHTVEVCHKRKRQQQQQGGASASTPANNNNTLSLLSSTESALNVFHLDPTMLTTTPNITAPENKHNVHVFTMTGAAPGLSKWVLDSGATCCATFAEADCVDVRDCQAHVTAAGSTFPVHKMGTAVINTLDEKGRPLQLRMTNTLISVKFPYKLLALQQFTRKGRTCDYNYNGPGSYSHHQLQQRRCVGGHA
jgi:hypothetical protein